MFVRPPCTRLSNLVHSCVSDNHRILKKGTAHAVDVPELSCLHDDPSASDSEPEPPSATPACARGSRAQGKRIPATRKRNPSPSPAAPVRRPPKLPPSLRKLAQNRGDTLTLSDGRVVRKNNVRVRLGPPPPGTFGTPSRLDHERVFVHTADTRAHKKNLARRMKNAKAKRRRYEQYLKNRHTSPPPPTRPASPPKPPSPPQRGPSSPDSGAELRVRVSPVRRSTRRRTAVVVPGAVAINAISLSPPRPSSDAPASSSPPPLAPTTPPALPEPSQATSPGSPPSQPVVSNSALQCLRTLATITPRWSPEALMPRRLFDRISALIDWSLAVRPCLERLSRPPTLTPDEFRRFSDVPQYLAPFYSKLRVPRDLMPPPRAETLNAALTDALNTAASQSTPLPWVRRRVSEAFYDKEHQWSIFIVARRLLAEQLQDPANPATP